MRFRMIKKVCYLLTCWLLALGSMAAQPTAPAQEQQAREQLERRGIDEADLKARLLTEGIDVDNMSPEELLEAQPRIEAVLAAMEAEQGNALAPVTNVIQKETTANDQVAPQAGADLIADAALDAVQPTLPPSDIYGHGIFRNQSLEVYRTTDDVRPPDSYRLGVGDAVAVSIFGASQADLKFIIDNEGFIRPPSMPRIYLKGISLGQARSLVENRFSQYYVFRPGQFSFNVDAARTITINIFGETETNGSFTLSAVNTAFNALVAAGGPTEQGSVRKIKLLRGGQEIQIDVYDFLANPSKQADFFLETNDIIFVPLSETVVSVNGAVKRPMRYELLPDEDLGKAIDFAGGLLPTASPTNVTITRTLGNQERVINADLTGSGQQLRLQSSDVINVGSSEELQQEYVAIFGAVAVPGNYGFVPGMRLADLIQKGGLLPSSRQDVALLWRKNPDGTAVLKQLSIYEVLNNGEDNLLLQLKDELIVLNQKSFVNTATIDITGAVKQELTSYPYSVDGQMTVNDAILIAGGLQENASDEAFLIRQNPANTEELQYVRLDLADPASINQTLRPFDSLIVYSAERFNDPFEIKLRGAVRQPGDYRYDPSLGLKELFTLAGGFKMEAALNKIDVFRLLIDQNQPTQTLSSTLALDENYQIVNSSEPNFALRPYDIIVVRSVPEFELIKTVSVEGEVRYPGEYALDRDNLRLTDMIDKAGGLTQESFPPGATLYRPQGGIGFVVIKLDEVIRNPGISSNITLKDGDVLSIPKSLDLVAIRPIGTRATEAISDSLFLDGTINVAYVGKQSGKWYIDQYAAGFSEDARKVSLTVQYPNGELGRTRRFLWFKSYPHVRPGSTIYVDLKPPRKARREREEPVDWVGVTQVVLGGVTTTLTLYLLIDRLN